jgi:hypothetical protein
MSIHPRCGGARVRDALLARAAAVLLAGCEAARVAQPVAVPSPAEQGAAAAGTLGLSPASGVGPGASLAGRVQGWNAPAVPATKAQPETGTVQVLGRFPGTEQIATVDDAGMLIRPLPFGRTTAAAVHGGALYVASGDRYEVSVYMPGARLRSRIRGDRARLPVTAADVEAYRRELVTIGGPRDGRAERRLAQMLDG